MAVEPAGTVHEGDPKKVVPESDDELDGVDEKETVGGRLLSSLHRSPSSLTVQKQVNQKRKRKRNPRRKNWSNLNLLELVYPSYFLTVFILKARFKNTRESELKSRPSHSQPTSSTFSGF